MFLDCSEAFYSVNDRFLLHKLVVYGIDAGYIIVSNSNVFAFLHQSCDYVFSIKCQILNNKIQKYKTVCTKYGKVLKLVLK